GYIEDVAQNLEKLQAYINKNEYQKASDIAHALDGSSRSIGAKRLSRHSDNFYKIIQNGDHKNLEECIGELLHTFTNTQEALQLFLKNQKPNVI
ncbi:MAG: Hpt domain-containing protein, partial [Proteobacteria bacterium]|nr:Hpt domain-containing protein [Pseudomonadota bacterium]